MMTDRLFIDYSSEDKLIYILNELDRISAVNLSLLIKEIFSKMKLNLMFIGNISHTDSLILGKHVVKKIQKN